MATKREVELIIKARDQTSAAAKNIVKALNDVVGVNQDIAKSANPTNSALSKLSAEITKLQKTASSLTSLGRMATQFDRAAKNVDGLKNELTETSSKLQATAAVAQQSALKFAELQSAAKGAGAALAAQQGELAAARAEQARLSVEIAKAKENYQRLINVVRQQKGATDAQRDAIRSQRDSLISLMEAQTRQNAIISANQASVRGLGQAFSSLSQQAARAGTETARASEALGRVQGSAEGQADGIREAEAALSEARVAAGEAATALGGVEVKQEAIANESARVAAAIQKVSAALQIQRDVARQAAAQAAAGGSGAANSAFKQQEQAILAARQAALQAANEFKRLRAEVASVAEPSAVLNAELEAARANANAATAAFRQQVAALEPLRAAQRAAADATKAKVAAEREAQAAANAAATALQQQAAANQRAAIAARLLGRAVTDEAQAMKTLGPAAEAAANGVKNYDDKSRRALSLTQRFRGEVLSLATSFLGLYAAVSGVGAVIGALRSVEAAASRLNAVFDGDQSKVREELRFISQEADRLGLSFQVLSQEYGRLSIAADAANFSQESVRKIFTSVAEAARVNKVSTEELEGTFLALQQMISKGTVSMEELRRQLGDRLPGAFNIFADALGVTTAELDSMLRKGEVVASEENLLKFADELTKRFGGALPQALETVTTQIDRFFNNLFVAQTKIAEGGFADALEESLRTLNEFFKSKEGNQFFLELGAGLGTLVRVFTFVLSQAQLLLFVFKGFLAVRAAQYFIGIANSLAATSAQAKIGATQFLALDLAQQKQVATMAASANATQAMGVSLRILGGQLIAVGAAFIKGGVSSAAFATATRGLSGALSACAISAKALFLSLGPIAIASVAISAVAGLFIDMASDVPKATAALEEHTRQLNEYEREANEAERAGRAFNATLTSVSLLEARKNLEELSNEHAKLRDESFRTTKDVADRFARMNKELAGNSSVIAIGKLTDEFRKGKINAFEYQQELNKIALTLEGKSSGAINQYLIDLSSATIKTGELAQAVGRQWTITNSLAGKVLPDTNEELARLGLQYDVVTGKIGLATDKINEQEVAAAKAATAFGRLEELIPSLALDRSQGERRAQFDKDAADAIMQSAGLTPEEIERRKRIIDEARKALEATFKDERDRLNKKPKQERDAQKEFNDELKRTNELRDFERTLIGRSLKEQEIELAIFQKKQDAAKQLVEFSAEQEAALRKSLSDSIDATEAERVKNLTLEDQVKLREELGLVNSVQDRIEIAARREKIDLLTAEGKAWAEVQKQIFERADAEKEVEKAVERVRALERQRLEALEEFNDARKAGELSPEEQRAQLIALEQMRLEIEAAKNEAIGLATALGDEKALAALSRLKPELSELQIETRKLATSLMESFAGGATEAIDQMIFSLLRLKEGTQTWDEALQGVQEAFRSFAAEFLLSIAKMITQSLILQAIQNSPLGGIFNDVAGFIAGINTGATAAATTLATAMTTSATTAATAITAAGTAATTGITGAGAAIGTSLTSIGATVGVAITTAGAAAAAAIAAAAAAAAAASVLHGGGIAGKGGMKRMISPHIFANATRFHTGGVAGLGADEVPAVLKQGEEVLTESDPRHRRNGGMGGAGSGEGVRILNLFDAADVVEKGLSTPSGFRTLVNIVRANKTAFQGALS